MFERKQNKDQSIDKVQVFQKGQTVIYQGEEASIVGVEPVFAIKIKNECHIVCGNRLRNELCLNSV